MRAGGCRVVLALGLGIAAGGAYALAFPPFALPGMAFVALAPLLVVATRVRPALAAAAGLAWSLAAAIATAPWLPTTLASRFQMGETQAWLGLLALGLFPAGVAMAALCAWLAWCSARRVLGVAAVAAGFGLFEAARSLGPTGVPWALLGASALPEPLVACASAVGVFGLGIAVAACNAAFALALSPALRPRQRGRPLALACAAALALGAAAPERSTPATPGGEPLRIALVQPGVVPAHEPAAPERAIALSRRPAARRADLVVWPENAFPGYLREESAGSRRVLALSRELRGELIVGAPHYRYAQPEPRYFASAFLVRAGELRARHDKTRLVPFAEARFTRGRELAPLTGAHTQFGVLICAELLFSDVARELARAGAAVLVNPSNDAWLAPAASAHLLQLGRLRALETGRPLLRATPTGTSAAIDAHGRVLARSRTQGAELVVASVEPSRRTPWCLRFGDWPLAVALVSVALTTWRGLLAPPLVERKADAS